MSLKNICRSLTCLSVLAAVTTLPMTAARADDPKVVKSLMVVTASRFGNYFNPPTAKEPQYNTWCWLPKIGFTLLGPIDPGSQLTVEWFKADGSPWLTSTFDTPEVAAGATHGFGNDYPTQESGHRAITAIGTFTFKIRIKNELAGTNHVIYTGKYNVTKFHKGNALPAFKNQFEYVVDQDWRLPIGYLTANMQIDDKAPRLDAFLWFKGGDTNVPPKGYLYYEGKLIGSGEVRAGSSYNTFSILTSGMDDKDPAYHAWDLAWSLIRLYNSDPENTHVTDGWMMAEHPGKYEIKVLWGGKLARDVKFEVGKDGKISDGGLAANNGVGAVVVVPVEVIGSQDQPFNKWGWKNDAYYGNPLPGFNVTVNP